MSRRYVRGVIASLLLHAVLVGVVLIALPRSEVLPALFVDLTIEPERVGAGAAPRANTAATRPERRTESAAASPRASDGVAAREPEPPPAATSESVVPAPAADPPPTPVSAPEPPPPTVPNDATATASAPVTTAPPPTTFIEREAPSASAALPSASATLNGGDRGAAPAEPAAAPARGGGALADSATQDDAGPRGTAGTREEIGAGLSSTSGGRAGQEIARRSPGSDGGEAQAVYTEYLARLRQRVHEALRYPAAARRRGLTGAVTIELTILPSGLIRDVSIVESSSHAILDEAAVDTVRSLRTQPFPGNVPPRTLRIRLPVVFQLQ